MTDLFGDIITAGDVEDAVEAFIRAWQGDYLAEVAAQAGLDRNNLPLFRSFPRLVDMSKWEEDQTPACIIAAPGTLDTPTVRDQAVNVRWAVGIGCLVSAMDAASTLRLAQRYAAAIRTMFMQHQSLGGFASGVVLMSERYDDLFSADDTRSVAAGVIQFGVDVLAVSNVAQGPSAPSKDTTIPPGDWPTVADVGIDLEKVN